MSNNAATALLALVQANKALAQARQAFLLLDDDESAALMAENIEDNETIISALVAKRAQRFAS